MAWLECLLLLLKKGPRPKLLAPAAWNEFRVGISFSNFCSFFKATTVNNNTCKVHISYACLADDRENLNQVIPDILSSFKGQKKCNYDVYSIIYVYNGCLNYDNFMLEAGGTPESKLVCESDQLLIKILAPISRNKPSGLYNKYFMIL